MKRQRKQVGDRQRVEVCKARITSFDALRKKSCEQTNDQKSNKKTVTAIFLKQYKVVGRGLFGLVTLQRVAIQIPCQYNVCLERRDWI